MIIKSPIEIRENGINFTHMLTDSNIQTNELPNLPDKNKLDK